MRNREDVKRRQGDNGEKKERKGETRREGREQTENGENEERRKEMEEDGGKKDRRDEMRRNKRFRGRWKEQLLDCFSSTETVVK